MSQIDQLYIMGYNLLSEADKEAIMIRAPIITGAVRIFCMVAMAISWNIFVPIGSLLLLQVSAVLLKKEEWGTDIDQSLMLALSVRIIVEILVLVIGVHAVGVAFGEAAKWITASIYVLATVTGR